MNPFAQLFAFLSTPAGQKVVNSSEQAATDVAGLIGLLHQQARREASAAPQAAALQPLGDVMPVKRPTPSV